MNERRAETRMLCSELVDVHWKDVTGRQVRALANLEDISGCGVCLQVDTSVPLDTIVRICHPKGEFQGSVRYCLYREFGYFLGVQFTPGCQWSRYAERQYAAPPPQPPPRMTRSEPDSGPLGLSLGLFL